MIVLEESSFSRKGSAQDNVETSITKETKFVVGDGGGCVQVLRPEIQVEG